jgi:tripartite-type tricarboxylate transporter receptor subunit TctC
VNSTSSIQSLAQLIAAARQGPLSIGATGPNTTQHVAVEALKQATNANLIFVPFGGDPPALSSLLGGHLDAGLNTYTGVRPHLGAALRPLAVGARERVAELPDVPTFSEAGFDIHANTFVGLVVPEKTPEHVTAQIAAHFRSALDTPEINTKVKALGVTPVGLCGKDFATYLRQHDERIARIVKAANMKAE